MAATSRWRCTWCTRALKTNWQSWPSSSRSPLISHQGKTSSRFRSPRETRSWTQLWTPCSKCDTGGTAWAWERLRSPRDIPSSPSTCSAWSRTSWSEVGSRDRRAKTCCILHFVFWILHFTFRIWHFAFCNCILQFAICSLNFAFRILNFAFRILHRGAKTFCRPFLLQWQPDYTALLWECSLDCIRQTYRPLWRAGLPISLLTFLPWFICSFRVSTSDGRISTAEWWTWNSTRGQLQDKSFPFSSHS